MTIWRVQPTCVKTCQACRYRQSELFLAQPRFVERQISWDLTPPWTQPQIPIADIARFSPDLSLIFPCGVLILYLRYTSYCSPRPPRLGLFRPAFQSNKVFFSFMLWHSWKCVFHALVNWTLMAFALFFLFFLCRKYSSKGRLPDVFADLRMGHFVEKILGVKVKRDSPSL